MTLGCVGTPVPASAFGTSLGRGRRRTGNSAWNSAALLRLLQDRQELFHRRREDLVLFVNRRQLSEKLSVLELHCGERLLGNLLHDRPLRHDGDARVNFPDRKSVVKGMMGDT